jgi:predicted P-loop ATPase
VEAGGPPSSDDWRGRLTLAREGHPEGTLHNLCLIIEQAPALAGLFWLNESSNQVRLNRNPPWASGSLDEFTDTDGCELAAWLQNPEGFGMKSGADIALSAVVTVARRHRRHPIREYLQGLKWDQIPRVEGMFGRLFGVVDNDYSRRAAQCFMVSAVARVLWSDPKQPKIGAKVDFMLVLEGAQGKKKTTALQDLFGANWYVETLESPSGKDFYQVLQGVWAVEIAEMDSFSKADVTSVKGAITRRSDTFRAPYEKAPRTWRRECIFVGTTNESEYLRDATGGRRFLPVRVQDHAQILHAEMLQERDQLWAEAVAMFAGGFEWWQLPEAAEDEQEARYVGDSWEDRVSVWLSGRDRRDSAYPLHLALHPGPIDYTTTDALLTHAVGLDAGRHGRPEQMRVAAIMKRLGFCKTRSKPDANGHRERGWERASAQPPAAPLMSSKDDDCPF